MTAPHPHHHSPAAHHAVDPERDPVAHWEERYAGEDRIWSGKVNATLVETVGRFSPGAAIDLGCGEGADVLWLAENGWDAHGLDISATAIGRARVEAAARGVDSARFTATDLTAWQPEPGTADLVTASFFQSQVALDRTRILRRAATALRPGGHLVTISHAAPPSWASGHPAKMIRVADEVAQLAQPEGEWEVLVAEERPRAAVGPDGHAGEHLDAVVVLRKK